MCDSQQVLNKHLFNESSIKGEGLIKDFSQKLAYFPFFCFFFFFLFKDSQNFIIFTSIPGTAPS